METKINGFKVINNDLKFINNEEKEKRKKQVAYDLYRVLSKFNNSTSLNREVESRYK